MPWHDLLQHSIDCEMEDIAADSRDIIEKLTPVLKKWEKLPQVSFATAVSLRGDSLSGIANGLPASDNELYETFLKLTEKPLEDLGQWPWGLLRNKEQDKAGIFPPQPLLLEEGSKTNACNSSCLLCKTITGLTDAKSIDANCINDDFASVGADAVALSWKWYAAYPAILGDAMRDDGKKTVAMVYILGTRREFQRQSRIGDFGLMVGLTTEAFDNGRCLKPAVGSILAAWNLLAVAPHIVSDGKRIATLDAAQRLTHTFKTYVEAHALPSLKAHCENCSDKNARGEAENVVRSISGLTSMMAFVAEGGVNGAIRPDVDVENYALCEQVQTFWEAHGFEVVNGCCEGGGEKSWVKWQYLQSAMLEVVSNVAREAGTGNGKKVQLTCEDKDDNQYFVIHVTNPATTPHDKDIVRNVAGLKALKVFFEALGGDATSQLLDDNQMFVTVMRYNLTAWKAKIESLSTAVQNGTHNASSPENAPAIPSCNDIEKSAGLRILLLDDELAFPAVAYGGLKTLQEGWCLFEQDMQAVSDSDRDKKQSFTTLYNASWGVELVLCHSVISARNYLLKETFDICLVDIDFGMDVWCDVGVEGPPRLGGLLFALARPVDKRTVISVFTAKDDTLRKDPDYTYLAKCADYLGEGSPVFFEKSTKDIAGELKKAFYKWCRNVLTVPGLLHPKSAELIALSEALYQENEKDPNFLYFLPDNRHANEVGIAFAVFGALLDESQKMEMASLLNRAVCGHALVRQLFCKLAHAKQRVPAITLYLDPRADIPFEDKAEFIQVFKDAMDLFGINDKKSFAEKLEKDFSNVKTCRIRIKLSTLVSMIGKDYQVSLDDIYFYALQENPEGFWNDVAAEIKDVVFNSKVSGRKSALTVKTIKLDQAGKETCNDPHYGWSVIMEADRRDNSYVSQGEGKGGSFEKLRNYLGSFAQSVFVRGHAGCYDLLAERSISCADCGIACGNPINSVNPTNVQLGIVVRHVVAED